MLRWCVVQTLLREEDRAIENLKRQAFNVFYPLLREHRGKTLKVVPMFSRYVFVEIETDELDWLQISSTRGVKRIMTTCLERPSLLPVGWVEALMSAGEITDVFLDGLAFKKGDVIEFTEGPFQGQRGVCQWTSEKRVALLLDLLGRQTMVMTESKSVKKIVDKTDLQV